MKWLSVAVLLMGSIACLPNASLALDRVRENDSAPRPKRMIGGSLTTPVPWHAMVYLSENILDGGFAGGTLIAERWILTAGRNLFVRKSRSDTKGKEPLIPKVYLGIGMRSDADASTEVAVEKVFLHPGFQNTSDWDNDLALIKLKEPVKFSESVMPIPMPEIGDNQEDKKGARGIIAGWGWGSLFTPAPILKFLALPTVPCQGKYRAKVLKSTPTVTDKQFCTGPSRYQENVCFGDAGGALALLNPNTNAVYAAGILSFDKACSVEDQAVYIKISAYLPWIHSLMRGDSQEFGACRASVFNRMFLQQRHNDLPWQLRSKFNNQLDMVDLNELNSTHTDIDRIKKGRLSAQFWAAFVSCDTQYKDAVRQTLEQIDVIHRMCQKYPEDFTFASSSRDIEDAFAQNKTACLIGVEGGHSIDSSLATLRIMYQMGVRYLTLTHSCNTPWADNWLVDTGSEPAVHNGLSDFGKQVILEMNRMGMLVDLAHVSEKVMKQVLELSKAPVIFSHSSAYSICPHKRNVPDDVLLEVKNKNGIVMINFFNDYVTCQKNANISHVADHFDHIKKVAGSSIIGFGGDYDGVPRVPDGLEDVSKYPDLVAELLRRRWTDDDVKNALGKNLLRVFKEVERVRDTLSNLNPDDVPIPLKEVQNPCRTNDGYPDETNSACTPSLYPLVFALALLTRLL